MVIDFHLHVTRTEEYNEWFLDWMRRVHGERGLDQLRTVLASPEGLLRYMDDQGIDYVGALRKRIPW